MKFNSVATAYEIIAQVMKPIIDDAIAKLIRLLHSSFRDCGSGNWFILRSAKRFVISKDKIGVRDPCVT